MTRIGDVFRAVRSGTWAAAVLHISAYDRADRLTSLFQKADMNPVEAQSKAIIAAALIVRGAVEVPSVPSAGHGVPDVAGMRLRELTDYVFRLLTIDQPHEP